MCWVAPADFIPPRQQMNTYTDFPHRVRRVRSVEEVERAVDGLVGEVRPRRELREIGPLTGPRPLVRVGLPVVSKAHAGHSL